MEVRRSARLLPVLSQLAAFTQSLYDPSVLVFWSAGVTDSVSNSLLAVRDALRGFCHEYSQLDFAGWDNTSSIELSANPQLRLTDCGVGSAPSLLSFGKLMEQVVSALSNLTADATLSQRLPSISVSGVAFSSLFIAQKILSIVQANSYVYALTPSVQSAVADSPDASAYLSTMARLGWGVWELQAQMVLPSSWSPDALPGFPASFVRDLLPSRAVLYFSSTPSAPITNLVYGKCELAHVRFTDLLHSQLSTSSVRLLLFCFCALL